MIDCIVTGIYMQIHRSPFTSHLSIRGFSLIELMIVVSIVAIIAAISIPSYNNYVLKAHRKEAISYIFSLTETLERARSTLLSYKSFDNFTSSQSTHYQYTIDVSDDGGSYTIRATAVGNQEDDKCGNMIYRSDNSWVFGNASLNTQDCL